MQRNGELVRFHYGENNINTGPLKEIPQICVDHFYGDDLNSSVFFLSHAHTDHLVGLETDQFMRRLKQPGIKLYCHPLTPILLGSFQRYLRGPEGIRNLIAAKKIVPLDVGRTVTIRIPRVTSEPMELEVKVTLLSAGHCPGSVMFLFETNAFRILHTGDFRLTLEDLKRMPHLHDQTKKPKSIDHLYVDTTFCSKSANLFPNRKEVLVEAMDHINGWISFTKNHVVYISFSAKFAHEYVLLELYKKFKQKIHVTPERLEIYKHIPDLLDCVTLNNDTQLHLCGDRSCVESAHSIMVRLSAIWYTRSAPGDRQNISWYGKNMNLCYSMHSSLEEIAHTIDYLKPKLVTPLVLPVRTAVTEIQEALRSVCNTPFQFEDYRSTRDDFGECQPPPSAPCAIEKDDTDIGDKEMNEDNEVVDTDSNNDSSQELSPVLKRSRLDDGSKSVWQFTFSPSPTSKYSQSSSEGSQNNSQEMYSQGSELEDLAEKEFMKPMNVPKVSNNARRNLDEALTNVSTHLEPHHSSTIENSGMVNVENIEISLRDSGSINDAPEEDEEMLFSQRL